MMILKPFIQKKKNKITVQTYFGMQLQDIKYLTENIWASQSILSAWDDINDLVMVRWDKNVEWSPWNCILLTKDEGAAHLKLERIEKVRCCTLKTQPIGLYQAFLSAL